MSEIWQQNSMTRVWCHLNFVIFNRFTVRRIIHESIWDVHYVCVCVCINIYLYLYNHHISQKTVDSWTLQGWGIHSKQSTHPCLTLTSVFHIWGPSVVQVPPYLQLLSHGFSLLLMLQYCGIYWKNLCTSGCTYRSVTRLCLSLCDPMGCSMPDIPVNAQNSSNPCSPRLNCSESIHHPQVPSCPYNAALPPLPTQATTDLISILYQLA